MNMVLYKRGTTDFNNNGLGILAEAFDVSVKDTVNDLFVCDFKYPITGRLFKELANGDIIRVDASPLLKSQRFTIQTITHNDKGYVSVHGLHKMIADMSTDYLKEPIQSNTAQSCAYAMNLAFNKSYKCKNYIAKTDIVNGQTFNISRRNLQNVLLGKEGSIIDTFGVGAEIEYDNSKGDVVSILRRRGHETNVSISYAKNISGYNCVMDVQELYTVIVPFAVNNDTKETIYGADVYAPNWEDFDGELFIKEQDFTDRFEQDEEITQEKLKKHAEDYLLETKCNEPKFTFKIDFIQLENKYLDEYNLDSLYEVNIGDTVYVYHRLYNVRTQARINSIVYDPATNKITKLIIGDVRPVFTTDSLKGKDGVDGKDGKDGIDGVDGVPGPPGENGESLYTWIKYATSNSGTNMSDDPTGRDYIGVAYNKPTALESNNPTDYTWSLYKGEDGIDGIPGKDGTTFYTWIKYADDAEGNGMSDTPEGKSYMGIAYNKLTKEESTNPKDYAWSLIKGADGQNGSMETLPDVLPDVPVARAHVYGVGSVEISWSFDNRFYFDYEVYASSVKGFTPTIFDRIFRGKASSTTQQVTPPKTMYYRVRAVNSHNKFTEFSNEVEVSVKRIEDMNNYFSEIAIGKAVVQSLTADYMEAGIIKGNWIDAKELTVTNGNGLRTLYIDSFGNVQLKPSVFTMLIDGKEENIVTESVLKATEQGIRYTISEVGGDNEIADSEFKAHGYKWYRQNEPRVNYEITHLNKEYGRMISIGSDDNAQRGLFQRFKTIPGQKYTCSFYAEANELRPLETNIGIEGVHVITLKHEPGFKRWAFEFTATSTEHSFIAYILQAGTFYLGRVMVNKGPLQEFSTKRNEVYSTSVALDIDGVSIDSTEVNTKTNIDAGGLSVIDKRDGKEILSAKHGDVVARGGHFKVTHPQNGDIVLWGRDVVINNGRALVGTGNVSEIGANKLFINYSNDFFNGVEIAGDLTNDGKLILSLLQNQYGTSGFIVLSSGLIIQYGHVNGLTVHEGKVVDELISYPLTFPNSCISFVPIVATVDKNNYWASRFNCIGELKGREAGLFYAYNWTGMNEGSLMDISYIAIGY